MNNAILSRLKLAGLGVFIVLAHHANGAWAIFKDKVQAQQIITEGVYRWTDSFNALHKSMEQWGQIYTKEGTLQDLRGLLEMANFEGVGLSVRTDDVAVVSVDGVRHNDVPIGLTKVCLATMVGGDGKAIKVSAQDYRTLFSGIKSMTDRGDIDVGSIVIQGDKGRPTAALGNFCILLSRG